jgi:hypothetical protein
VPVSQNERFICIAKMNVMMFREVICGRSENLKAEIEGILMLKRNVNSDSTVAVLFRLFTAVIYVHFHCTFATVYIIIQNCLWKQFYLSSNTLYILSLQ